jgi:formylglycine-generating enzyme required for sulfatase activity
MRRIRAVAKYELTWNNYLVAVDDARCGIPKPYRVGFDAQEVERSNEVVATNLDRFRVDWPIVMLGVEDIRCYISWLQERTSYRISLPSEKEWEWFALAGKEDARFPWGNDIDPKHEALPGSIVARLDEIAVVGIQGSRSMPKGVRVGLFQPNRWGIYDLMGNVQELTADIISGEQWRQLHPDSALARNMPPRDRVVIKGSDRYSADWKKGIPDRSFTMIWDGRYAADVGVRLVLSDE